MMVWLAASFHPSLEILKIKKTVLKNVFSVIQPYIMPKSDFIFLAHAKSCSTAKVLAKVLVFQQLFNHKTDCTVRKPEKGCLKPTTQVITMLEALASRPAIQSIKTHYQVTELHALNARTKTATS